MAVAIFSCSKNINENKKSSSGREIYFKTCEFMNKKWKMNFSLLKKTDVSLLR